VPGLTAALPTLKDAQSASREEIGYPVIIKARWRRRGGHESGANAADDWKKHSPLPANPKRRFRQRFEDFISRNIWDHARHIEMSGLW